MPIIACPKYPVIVIIFGRIRAVFVHKIFDVRGRLKKRAIPCHNPKNLILFPQSRRAARHSRGGSEMRLRYSLKIKQSLFQKSLGAPLFARPHPNFYDMLPFKKMIFGLGSGASKIIFLKLKFWIIGIACFFCPRASAGARIFARWLL